jgi:Na+-translocating ferredoxin:NAD+ oxidoreductase RnfC subunit
MKIKKLIKILSHLDGELRVVVAMEDEEPKRISEVYMELKKIDNEKAIVIVISPD